MSFLQRFEGKTQKIGKGGINNVFGDNNAGTVIMTNTNMRTQQKHKSINSAKQTQQVEKKTEEKKRESAKNYKPIPPKPPKTQNPFLVSNPFYLDQEEKMKQQKQKKEVQRRVQQAKRAASIDQKQSTKTSSINRSLDKKGNSKQWVKLGGLGANIGGDEWLEKKKKVEKMQQFAGQVKTNNNQMIKPIDLSKVKEEKKQPDSRSRALQFAKTVPKPVIKRQEEEEQEVIVQNQKQPNQLSELQLYAQKHQKLKNMLKKEY